MTLCEATGELCRPTCWGCGPPRGVDPSEGFPFYHDDDGEAA